MTVADYRRPTTISDVAAAAGVSASTVSVALNGRSGVATSTRERVEQAAKVLRYRPSSAAPSLKVGTERTIGLSLPAEIRSPSIVVAVLAAAYAGANHGVRLCLLPPMVERELYTDLFRSMDAVILLDQRADPGACEDLRVPVVATFEGSRPEDGPSPAVEELIAGLVSLLMSDL